jgi:phosphonopyruvate decarboxylase
MIEVQDFTKPVLAKGYDFWAGVPCSFLKPLINYAAQCPDLNYISASSEGEAVGVAIGAYLAGRKTIVLCQNSGLGNMVNPLTSLNHTFRIPSMIIVTHRGAPGLKDEPQHALMGSITAELLDTMQIPWEFFPDRVEDVEAIIDKADRHIKRESSPYALIMKKGALSPYPHSENRMCKPPVSAEIQGGFESSPNNRMSRYKAIQLVRKLLDNEGLIVATTGEIGRELFELGHRANQFYILGGMGCASAIGLGLSLCQKKRKVIVLDGDGAALMRMGTMATIGYYHPDNLIHTILDNESYESTGGQATVSTCIDFALIAAACSYNAVFRCDTEYSLKEVVKSAINVKGPVCIHVKVATEANVSLGRPTLPPVEIKEQFMRYIASD